VSESEIESRKIKRETEIPETVLMPISCEREETKSKRIQLKGYADIHS
jgi:hypothetical protein